MKSTLITFINLIFSLSLSASTVNISDRLLAKKYFYQEQELFNKVCADKQKFEFLLEPLNMESKKIIISAMESLSPIFPTSILYPLLCARYIEKDVNLSQRLLAYTMTYRMIILRDYLDSPVLLPKDYQKAHQLLISIADDETLNTANIYDLTQPAILEISKIIAKIQNDNAFIRAIQDTPLLTTSFAKSIANIPANFLSPWGYIAGNSTEFLQESSQKLIFLPDKRYVTIPLYFDMPSRLSQNTHPTFMHSQIMRKVKSTIDLSNNSLYLNLKSIDGSLGGTIVHYLLNSLLFKVKKNPSYKVLINHQMQLSSPLYQYILKRLEEDQLANSLKLISLEPADSNTIIADVDSQNPFALTMSFALTDQIVSEKLPLQAFFLRGPIVAALHSNLIFYNKDLIKNFKDEWSKTFIDLPAHYPYVGSDVLTLYTQNTLEKTSLLQSAFINELLKQPRFIGLGSTLLPQDIYPALGAYKSFEKQSQVAFLIDEHLLQKGLELENLVYFDRLRKQGVSFISKKNEKLSFAHLSLFYQQSLIFDNSLALNNDKKAWSVPLHFFKSTLIRTMSRELEVELNQKKNENILSLKELKYSDHSGAKFGFDLALKESLLQQKFSELLEQF